LIEVEKPAVPNLWVAIWGKGKQGICFDREIIRLLRKNKGNSSKGNRPRIANSN